METLEQLGSPFVWVLRTTLHASLLAAVVYVVQRVFRKHLSARWLNALWMLVVIKLVLPVAPTSGWSVFNLLPEPTTTPSLGAPTSTASPVWASEVAWAEDSGRFQPLEDSNVDLTAASPADGNRDLFVTLLGSIWVFGALWVVGAAFVGSVRFSRLVKRGGRPLEDPSALDLFARVRNCLNYHRPIPVIETDLVDSPALFGFFSPRLMLPIGLAGRLTPRELQHVFAHEVAHLKRGDLYIEWLFVVARGLHWFNPLSWLVVGATRAARELACDALALKTTPATDPVDYGRTLLKLVEAGLKKSPRPLLVGIVENKSGLAERLRALPQARRNPTLLGRLLLIAVALTAFTEAKSDSGQAPATSPIGQAVSPDQKEEDPATIDLAGQPNAPKIPETHERLQRIILPLFLLPKETTLADAIKALSSDVRKHDPKGLGVNFILSSTLRSPASKKAPSIVEEFTVALPEPLRNVAAVKVLEALIKNAKPHAGTELTSLKYEVHAYAVTISATSTQNPPLHTRRYRVDPEHFLRQITKSMGGELDSVMSPEHDSDRDIQARVSAYFKNNGINLGSHPLEDQPSTEPSISFNRRNGILMVRASAEELSRLERHLHKLMRTDQILIEATVATVATDAPLLKRPIFEKATETSANGLHYLGSLNEATAGTISSQFDKAPGLSLLGAARLATLFNKEGTMSVRGENDTGAVINFAFFPKAAADLDAVIDLTTRLEIFIPPNDKSPRVEAKGDHNGLVVPGQTAIFALPSNNPNELFLLLVSAAPFVPGKN